MKIIIFFTILLLHVVTSVNCAYIKDDKNSTSLPTISQADSKTIAATGVILSLIDLVACLFVFFRTYLQWKQRDKNSIPMSLRYPFYIASVEFCVSILQTINSSSGSKVITRASLCSAIGLLSMFSIGFAMNLVTFVTFIIWYKFKKNVEFHSGRYDYIIFLTSSGLSIFYTLLGVGEYGSIKYWCPIQPNRKAILYMVLVIMIIHVSFVLTLYINTRINLKKLKPNQLSFNAQNLPEAKLKEIETVKKMFSYTLAFVFQLFLLMLYIIISTTAENTLVILLRILGITIGGLLIALQYIINEGWKHKPISSSQRPQSQSLQSAIRNSIHRLPFTTRIQVEVVQQQVTRQDIWSV